MEYQKNRILKKQNIKKNGRSKKWNDIPQGLQQLRALENGILKKIEYHKNRILKK